MERFNLLEFHNLIEILTEFLELKSENYKGMDVSHLIIKYKILSPENKKSKLVRAIENKSYEENYITKIFNSYGLYIFIKSNKLNKF
jgi:hypothetical protein